MTTKRALIVDDSRSARVILSRMLEAYDLQVDAAESAEQALEYLRQNRPDVVFMDHLMPGMDGFQAIQAIKSNPDTATIPVMMYTSQEGELYVSQARALGAVGVLPKTVKQGDVSRVLYQLHLLPERREGRSNLFEDEGDAPAAPAAPPPPRPQSTPASAMLRTGAQSAVQIDRGPTPQAGDVETAVRSAMAPALREYNGELRRYIAASMEVLTRKIAAETKPASATEPPAVVATPDPVSEPSRWPLIATVAALTLIPSAVLAVFCLKTLESTQALRQSYTQLASVVEEQSAQLAALAAAQTASSIEHTTTSAQETPDRQLVPYGEAPWSGARLDHLRTLIDKLRADGFKGKVIASSYAGEFCLTGNGLEGYSIAADDLPVRRCDLIANPFDESLTAAQRQSLAFANFVASVPQQSGNTLSIEVTHGGRNAAVAYPDGQALEKTTAGEWNRIAAQNNRVEFVAVTQ